MESNIEYKQKYLEYKLKYLDKKYNQTGGMELKFTSDGTQVNKVLPGVAARAAAAAAEPAERAAAGLVRPTRPAPSKPVGAAGGPAIPHRRPEVAAIAASAARPVIPHRRPSVAASTVTQHEPVILAQPVSVVTAQPVSVVTAHASVGITPFPIDKLKEFYLSRSTEYYLYNKGSTRSSIEEMISVAPYLTNFNYAICINKDVRESEIVIVNMTDKSNYQQLKATVNMFIGITRDSNTGNKLSNMLKNGQFEVTMSGDYTANIKYDLIVFLNVDESPLTMFGGFNGLSLLVKHFFE